jgi:hypothetical protein
MKALKLLVAGMAMFFAFAAQAQVSVHVNLPSPPPPPWGPAGYTDVRYYYLPDVEAYYDVPSAMFIYNERGSWVHRSHLPGRYRNYDLYGGYKVVMSDYRGDAPYANFKEHKMKYGRGYHGEAQRSIGERPGKGNPGMRESRSGNPGNREGGQGNVKSRKEGPGHGGGKGRKK